jgi:hypothetical protein
MTLVLSALSDKTPAVRDAAVAAGVAVTTHTSTQAAELLLPGECVLWGRRCERAVICACAGCMGQCDSEISRRPRRLQIDSTECHASMAGCP